MSVALTEAAATAARSQDPFLEITWTDPVSGRKGYLVIDRLVRGVCSGGPPDARGVHARRRSAGSPPA